MADFSKAVNKVLRLEGGYQNFPEDWGNYNAYDTAGNLIPYRERRGKTLRAGTNYGISAALFSGMLKREVSKSEMQNLTKQKALSIYKKHYWDRAGGDEIKNQSLAELIFDGLVNHGVSLGSKIVQRVLNQQGKSLAVDGKIGRNTLTAINNHPVENLYTGIVKARHQKYHELAQKRPGNDRFLKGWLNRLSKFNAYVLDRIEDAGKAVIKSVKENKGRTVLAGLALLGIGIFLVKRK